MSKPAVEVKEHSIGDSILCSKQLVGFVRDGSIVREGKAALADVSVIVNVASSFIPEPLIGGTWTESDGEKMTVDEALDVLEAHAHRNDSPIAGAGPIDWKKLGAAALKIALRYLLPLLIA